MSIVVSRPRGQYRREAVCDSAQTLFPCAFVVFVQPLQRPATIELARPYIFHLVVSLGVLTYNMLLFAFFKVSRGHCVLAWQAPRVRPKRPTHHTRTYRLDRVRLVPTPLLDYSYSRSVPVKGPPICRRGCGHRRVTTPLRRRPRTLRESLKLLCCSTTACLCAALRAPCAVEPADAASPQEAAMSAYVPLPSGKHNALVPPGALPSAPPPPP